MLLLYTCTNVCLFILGASNSNVILLVNNTCSVCPTFSLSARIVADNRSSRRSQAVERSNCLPGQRTQDSPRFRAISAHKAVASSLSYLSTSLPRSGFSLAPALWPWGATLHGPSLRALDVVRWDPVLIVTFGSTGHSRPICTSCWDTFISCTLLGRAALRTVAAPPTLLRKVGGDPDRVEEVDDANEAGEDKEVEKDAGHVGQPLFLMRPIAGVRAYI